MRSSTAAAIGKRIDQLRAAGQSDRRIATYLQQLEVPSVEGRPWTAALVGQWMRDNSPGDNTRCSRRITGTPPRPSIET